MQIHNDEKYKDEIMKLSSTTNYIWPPSTKMKLMLLAIVFLLSIAKLGGHWPACFTSMNDLCLASLLVFLCSLLTSYLLNILPANMSTTSNATNNQRVFISLVGDGACWYYWFWFWHQNNFDRKRFYFGKYFLNKECHWWGVNYCPAKMCGDSVKTEAGY